MTENLRETFRLEPEAFDAQIAWQGRTLPCRVVNLSAGGARVTCELSPPVGATCRLLVRLASDLPGASAPAYETFEVEVLEQVEQDLRLRMTTPDAATTLVFAAQRAELAKRSGTDEASPMTSDSERRQSLRPTRDPRFTRKSLRPDAD